MAEPWIRVHANLGDKRVALRASEALSVSVNEAIGLLVRFWGAMSRMGHDGHVDHLEDSEIETWAGWPRSPSKRGRFAAFVRAQHTDSEGRVNEWDEYNGALESRREKDRDRQRRLRDMRRQSREESAVHHAERPRDIRVTSAPARANETKRNETSTTTAASPSDDDVQHVVSHYLARHPRRRPGSKDRKAIAKALTMGYTAAELCEAIDGNAGDEWHIAKSKHALDYVLRNNGTIDDFRERARRNSQPLVDPETGLLTPEAAERLGVGHG